jgi:hypothetical protein
MRFRELKKKSGSATVSAWPPMWASAYGPGSILAVGNEGVLDSVRRREGGLTLTMRFDNREHVGAITWDEPPTIAQVEAALKALIGESIQAISEIEIE